MTGGGNADIFRFTGSDLTTGPALGTVTDFSRAQGDLIDLRGLVAYSFIGSSAFTLFDEYGSSSEGEVRFDVTPAGIRLEGDVNGDSIADWFVELTGIHTLAASDIIFG
jgi:serralysin